MSWKGGLGMKRTYLGDGLYAEDHGFQFVLIAPREEGAHYVALDEETLDSFLLFIEKHRGVKFTVETLPAPAYVDTEGI